MGCAHTHDAPPGLLATFRSAVTLQLAVRAGQSQFVCMCDTCCSAGAPIACLECDFVGCPRHAGHTQHALGTVFTPTDIGLLWCFKCGDLVVDERFDRESHGCVVDARRQLDACDKKKGSTGSTGSAKPTGRPGRPAGSRNGNSGGNSSSSRNAARPNEELRPPFRAFTGLRGLVNMGATCYASVVLQSLVHNPLVRAYFLAGGHQHELCSRASCLACGVDEMFGDFFGSSAVGGYGITGLLVSLAEKQPVMGAGSTEQDAHEFYLMLLNEFHSASHAAEPTLQRELGARSDDALQCSCVAHRSFSGSIDSTLSCACGYTATRSEPIVDLGVNLPNAGSGGGQARLSLEDCLQRFTAKEQIANYVCEKCARPSTTTKQLRIAQPPPVLLIQLKRFKHLGSKGSSKVDTPVDFALQLDLAPYMSASPAGRRLMYELYGVICHTGTLDTGHYTCMMKHSSGQWFEFDDATVTAVDVSAVLRTQRAYLLCYIMKVAL